MKTRVRLLTFFLLLTGLIASCMARDSDKDTSTSTPASTNVWSSLLDITPVPYASPLPQADQTRLDGTYAKYDPAPPQWWSCLRCADYRPAGGAWRLQFDRGIMRIYYEVTHHPMYMSTPAAQTGRYRKASASLTATKVSSMA